MKINDNLAYAIIAVAVCTLFAVMLITNSKETANNFDKISVKCVVSDIKKNSGRYYHYYKIIGVSSTDSVVINNVVGTKSYVTLSEETYEVNDTINQIIEIPKIK
jgi:hypothetical protein